MTPDPPETSETRETSETSETRETSQTRGTRAPREIWVGGYPSYYGGADTELDHQIDLWLSRGVAVHLVPNGEPDPIMRADVTARGAVTHAYRPEIFAGKVVVSYCNGPFLERLPAIASAGRPRCVVWANCMTWTFPREIDCHRDGLIDRFLFQSRYQRSLLAPSLGAVREVVELEGYRPFFSLDRWSSGAGASAGAIVRPAAPAAPRSPGGRGYYGIGRVSRDDAAKYPHDLWRTWSRVTAPRPIKCFILGWGEQARKKCGLPQLHHGLDWMLWAPSAVSAHHFYDQIHTLVHQTGGSRENWPRVAFEAWASGVVVLAERDFAWKELIDDGENGVLCSSSDEFAYRASELAFDDAKRRRIAETAAKRLRAEHGDAEKSWAAWAALLD